MVLDGEAVAAGFIAQRAGDPRLARTGGSGEEQVEPLDLVATKIAANPIAAAKGGVVVGTIVPKH